VLLQLALVAFASTENEMCTTMQLDMLSY